MIMRILRQDLRVLRAVDIHQNLNAMLGVHRHCAAEQREVIHIDNDLAHHHRGMVEPMRWRLTTGEDNLVHLHHRHNVIQGRNTLHQLMRMEVVGRSLQRRQGAPRHLFIQVG